MKDTLQNNVNYANKIIKYTDQCPNKAMARRCPLREIVLVHVVQVEAPIVQEQKKLQTK
jgi:hypothetical protein